MKIHQFFSKYANTPLSDRLKLIKQNRYGGNIDEITLNTIYKELKAIEDKIRPDVIRRDELLEIAEGFLTT